MDKNVPNPVDEKVEDQGKQAEDVRKTTSGTDVISTAKQEEKAETVQTELLKTEAAKTEANKTEVAISGVAETELAKTEVDRTEVAQPEVIKTEVAQPEVIKTEVAQPEVIKTEVDRTEVAQPEVIKTEVAKTDVAQTELVKAEIDKTEVTEVVKTEVAKDKPEVADTEPKAFTTLPETIKTDTKPVTTEQGVAKTELASEPEVAKLKPEVNMTTPAYPEHVSSEPNSSETGQALTSTESKGDGKEVATPREPSGSGSGSGSGSFARPSLGSAATRTRFSLESDSEISDILRDAPPPTVCEEENDHVPSETSGRETGGGETSSGEVAGDTETIVIMKKTFTESVRPDQEFIPISEDSDNSATRNRGPLPDTLTVLASLTPKEVAKEPETDGRQVENGSGTVLEPEMTSDGENVLSKAQMEAQDLSSEFRRLQYLLENLTAFSDLELSPSGELPSLQGSAEQNRDQVPEPSTGKTEPEVESK